jgi:peptidoglycan/LPS O-acetylase OafA/YrhL
MLHRDPGNVDAAIAVGRLPSTDPLADFFGRASYHLFIAHMPVAALLFNGLYVSPNTFLIYVATLLAALGLSGLLVRMERRINDVRRQLRAPRSVGHQRPKQPSLQARFQRSSAA